MKTDANDEHNLGICLVWVYLAVMALLGLEVILSLFIPGVLAHGLIMGVAILMAGLVSLFFMRLRTSSAMVRVFAGAGLVWMFFMFSFIGADYFTR